MRPRRVHSGSLSRFVAALFILSFASPGVAEGRPDAKQRNLSTCLSGRYPILCNHALLSPDELERVLEAERAANLKTCLTGKYPVLCRHALLRGSEMEQVRGAERRENLRTCMSGKYAALCKHDLLTPAERKQVEAAERTENLRTCLAGRYPVLCKRALLTPDEAQRVAAAEKATVAPTRRGRTTVVDLDKLLAKPSPPKGKAGFADCESGHWIESVSDDGDVITLGDGSLWHVDPGDEVLAMLWLPVTDVVLCEGTGKLVNTDDEESAGVQRAR